MRKLLFEGDTLALIRQLPDDARHRAGYEIDRVQRDREPENWKPFPAIGQGAREIRIQVSRQYRIIYIAKFADTVHVLHVFAKKSQKTRKSDIEIAKNRLKEVIRRYR
ncbi:type II toxin-antitoxin system RelE/ParE family toxin [Sulfuriflexus sp.]|uniref:type II toxin-antitoxin system RelE/ParE family toxin n=1 Tax=Sulfuriflexus sp. TaxID=2015443 RepID=UPI0028CCF28D|nr:type II toxin-antitoxin system RelE/ParE family toxin [Sulfuriflexus sp.]MDT8403259.1 type II toxin-antitoxin system RelE/ParE family toxin [Sulfuriflexus sp.]